MHAEDPFISILRSKQAYSKSFLRSNSPPNIVQTSIYDRKRPSTGKGTRDTEVGRRAIVSNNPPAVCVNCSKPASICMSCSELYCKNALSFQRKGSTLGAIEFFKKAVKEAGNKRLVKLIVFHLWKNSYKIRLHETIRVGNAVTRMYTCSIIKAPFQAWKRFIKDLLFAKKNKKIDELSSKILQLEEVVRKLNDIIYLPKATIGK